MIAIVAALPREIAALVRGTKADPELLEHGVHLHRKGDVVVVAAGMGGLRATRAIEAAFRAGDVTDILSVGLAGACAPGVLAGTVLEAIEVIDSKTGEHFTSSSRPGEHSVPVVLVSSDTIAGVEEKGRLHRAYGALMVDMEAATVARLAAAHGVRFRAIKAISDEHDFELASLQRFAGKHGHFRTRAFALHTALRPHRWSSTMQLGRHSARALEALERDLRLTLAVHKIEF